MARLYHALLAALLLPLFTTGQKQEPNDPWEYFALKNYDQTDGLSQNLTTYMFCDSRGMVWIGSDEGLNAFDGSRFKKMFLGNKPGDLSGDRIVFITEDNTGKIWTVSASVDCYDPKTQLTRNFPFKPDGLEEPPRLRSIFIKSGEPIWVFTTAGLYFLDEKTGDYTPYYAKMPQNKSLSSGLYYDGYVFDKVRNQLWLGTYSGVACFDFNSRTLYNDEHNPDKLSIFANRVARSSFKQGPNGNIFFVESDSYSLVSYNLHSGRLKKYPLPAVNEKTLDYFALHPMQDGSIWLGLRNSGLFLLDTLTLTYTEFSNTPKYNAEIKSNYIWQISNDYQGNIWVCHGLGAAVIARQPFQYKTIFGPRVIKELARRSRLSQVYIDEKGKLWVAANTAHLLVYDPETEDQKVYKIPGPDSVGFVGVLPDSTDKLVLSGNAGLWEFTISTGKFRHISLGTKEKPFEHTNFDRKPVLLPDGKMALSEKHGIVLYQPKSETAAFFPYSFFNKAGSSLIAPFCLRPNGKGGLLVSFATTDISLYDWDLHTNRVTALHDRLPDSLKTTIRSIIAVYAAADGSYFISDRVFGFWKIDKDFKTFRHFTRDDGMLTNIVSDFASDHNQDIWLETLTGLSCLRTKTGLIESFEPGYPDITSFYFAFHIDTLRRKLYVSDNNYLRIIDYPNFKAKVPDFNIGISEIRVNGNRILVQNNRLPDLGHDENNISIDLATFNYFPNVQTSISYSLSNSAIPVKLNGSRQINLTGMESGRYTLTVFATGQYGKNSKPLKIQFRIHPVWYNTIWFRLLVIFTLIGLTGVFISWRKNQKLKELLRENELFKLREEKLIAIARERERITADLHDDMGATISSINIYGDLAAQVWDTQPEQSKKMIGQIIDGSKELMQNMSDIVWSLKADDEQRQSFTARLRNFSYELLTPKGIVTLFDIDETLAAGIKIPLARKNLLLIAKEALNNTAKYSGATTAVVTLNRQGEDIRLCITDNGKGFDPGEPNRGNGLDNMKLRCSRLQGTFSISSSPGKGVAICCTFPPAIFSYLEP